MKIDMKLLSEAIMLVGFLFLSIGACLVAIGMAIDTFAKGWNETPIYIWGCVILMQFFSFGGFIFIIKTLIDTAK